jgi:hypothetical protein
MDSGPATLPAQLPLAPHEQAEQQQGPAGAGREGRQRDVPIPLV